MFEKENRRKQQKLEGIWRDKRQLLGYITRCAKRRNIEFKITIEEAWEKFVSQSRLCALSGAPISLVSKTASLDRIDSNRGYKIGNIQWVHKDVNLMKMAMSQIKFIKWCGLIYKQMMSSYDEGLGL